MKPPYDAKTGELAKHNDFSTWTTYDIALKAHQENIPLKHPSTVLSVYPTRGLGCVLGKPFCGIDIDDCRNPDTGEIEASALGWIKDANTYTEISPSGTGVHMWLHGEPPYPEGHRKDGREIYSTNRYLTVTGAVLEGYEEIRRFTPSEVKEWYNRVKNYGKDEPKNPAQKITTFATTVAKIEELMTRTDYPDLSPMVQSLLTLLAIKHVLDPVKVEEEFKRSAIYNETHWKEKWERLGKGEIEKAIQFARENIQKRNERKSEMTVVSIDAPWDNEMKTKPLVYMWDPVLPLGKLVHFAGRSSEGKSPVTIDLIARLTRGDVWPDGSHNAGGPKKAILMNIEDGIEDMILPRYYLAGGVRGSLRCVRGVKIKKNDDQYDSLVALDRDISIICTLAREMKDLGLIVIDPITNYLGKLKMNAEEDVRQVLTPLASLAEELGIVVITVGHLNKSSENTDPLARIMGAAAFAGVARSVYLFGEDKEAKDNKYAHLMSPARGKKDKSYRYHTVEVEQDFDGIKASVVKVVWDGDSEQTVEDALDRVPNKQLSQEREASSELKNFLMSGKRPAAECEQFLKSCGFKVDDMNMHRVRKYAGVKHQQHNHKSWWFMPTNADLFEPSPARQQKAADIRKGEAPSF